MKIVCPHCGSDQFASNKNGFSAGKAVGGALLTGGIGLLAGFHGSKKVKITCLACGNLFNPGEGKRVESVISAEQLSYAPYEISPDIKIDKKLSDEISNINKASGIFAAIKHVQETKNIPFGEAKVIVDCEMSKSKKAYSNQNTNPGQIILFLIVVIVVLIVAIKLNN